MVELHLVHSRKPTPLPSGQVTFLLTDIEGSTRLWEHHGHAMATALTVHDELVDDTVSDRHGVVLKARGEGDSTFSVFQDPVDAVLSAACLRDRLETAHWPGRVELRVRMALHTGEAIERTRDYIGPTVNRAARLRDEAVGGQVLVSGATADLVAGRLGEAHELIALGEFRLRDLARPEHVFALSSSRPLSRSGSDDR